MWQYCPLLFFSFTKNNILRVAAANHKCSICPLQERSLSIKLVLVFRVNVYDVVTAEANGRLFCKLTLHSEKNNYW